MSLADLLKKRRIERALIVDDALDSAPRASDLQDQADQWAIFSTDIGPDERALINERSPETKELPFDEQILNDDYVRAVWDVRDQLGGLADALFETYKNRQTDDMIYVDLARKVVEGLGLACDTAGREFEAQAAEAKLILIDLYLGGAQNEAALEASMKRLSTVVAQRKADPPLVVLMSRSNQLQARRDQFRDDVGLIESGFRILAKSDLKVAGRLERQIDDLVDSLPETLKLARFFAALEADVNRAAERTLKDMRRLSLSDIAQIQQLLLEAEEAPAGSYLVDVFDRVLQHEIETEEAIISAALELNGLTPDRHPPAFASGSLELQQLVSKTLTQAKQRLQLPATPHSKVTFGDLLRVRKVTKRRSGAKGLIWPSDVDDGAIFLVITPVCDLQHGESPKVLMLVGEVQDLGRDDWRYKGDTRTPAIMIDDKLVWIKWNLKHVDTVTQQVLSEAMADKRVEHVSRLRESHAFELQQAALAGLGRVGLLAPMPANFPVSTEAYRVDLDGRLVALELPELAEGGVIWSGRDKLGNTAKKLVVRAVPSNALQDALAELDDNLIAQQARGALRLLQKSDELPTMLTRGIDITKMGLDSWFVPKRLPGEGARDPFLLIGFNRDVTGELSRNDLGKAGALLVLRARDEEAQPTLEKFIREAPANARGKPVKVGNVASKPVAKGTAKAEA